MTEEQTHLHEKKISKTRRFYEEHYKALLWIPIILMILAVAQIGYQVYSTGDFMNKGISLKGGVIITIEQSGDIDKIESDLKQALPKSDINVRSLEDNNIQTGVAITVDIDPNNKEQLMALENVIFKEFPALTKKQYQDNVQIITPQFSASFFSALMQTLLIAFVLMSIVVFTYFRTFVPSMAVILAVICDIAITLAIVNLLGIKISSGGIAAFLMLIGYSVDTDILLTSNMLKRKGKEVNDYVIKAVKTGVMMTATTFTAACIGLLFTISDDIRQIMIIIAIGLIIDTINTWIQNVGILRYYLERKNNVSS